MPKITSARKTSGCMKCYLLEKKIQQLEDHIVKLKLLLPIKKEKESIACQTTSPTPTGKVKETFLSIPYRSMENDDVLFQIEHLKHLFHSILCTDPDLEEVKGWLSLECLREKCRSLSFPYTEEEIQEQADWYFLLFLLEKRDPFMRKTTFQEWYRFSNYPDFDYELPDEQHIHFSFQRFIKD